MNTTTPHVLITGATGLLGRQVLRTCTAVPTWRVTGTAFRRVVPGLARFDFSQIEALPSFLDALAPDAIIHAAAERRPDVSEKDPEGTQRLNVDATEALANWAAAHSAFLIYISTDYVFDGTQPPYKTDAPTNPLNAYGRSKLAGEHAVRAICPDAVILRVPILYGEVETLAESSVTLIAQNMLNAHPGARLAMENWATRYPTHTEDVAAVLQQIVARRFSAHAAIRGTYHWSGSEPMTKYDMALAFAPLLGFDPARLVPESTRPAGAPRPQNAHLDTANLERLGIGQRTPFVQAIPSILAPHLPAINA